MTPQPFINERMLTIVSHWQHTASLSRSFFVITWSIFGSSCIYCYQFKHWAIIYTGRTVYMKNTIKDIIQCKIIHSIMQMHVEIKYFTHRCQSIFEGHIFGAACYVNTLCNHVELSCTKALVMSFLRRQLIIFCLPFTENWISWLVHNNDYPQKHKDITYFWCSHTLYGWWQFFVTILIDMQTK